MREGKGGAWFLEKFLELKEDSMGMSFEKTSREEVRVIAR